LTRKWSQVAVFAGLALNLVLHHVETIEGTFAMAAIESPCILVCSIDRATGYCFGCGRTQAEIGTWTEMTSEKRQSVMAELPARLETVERKPRRETRRSRMARERNTPS